jgi:hypothetical protein
MSAAPAEPTTPTAKPGPQQRHLAVVPSKVDRVTLPDLTKHAARKLARCFAVQTKIDADTETHAEREALVQIYSPGVPLQRARELLEDFLTARKPVIERHQVEAKAKHLRDKLTTEPKPDRPKRGNTGGNPPAANSKRSKRPAGKRNASDNKTGKRRPPRETASEQVVEPVATVEPATQPDPTPVQVTPQPSAPTPATIKVAYKPAPPALVGTDRSSDPVYVAKLQLGLLAQPVREVLTPEEYRILIILVTPVTDPGKIKAVYELVSLGYQRLKAASRI